MMNTTTMAEPQKGRTLAQRRTKAGPGRETSSTKNSKHSAHGNKKQKKTETTPDNNGDEDS
jgi:hypothetical protein